MQEIETIELSDGVTIEIKSQTNRQVEKPDVSNAYKDMLVASKVERLRPILRFFLIHPTYFRGFEEWGLPLLFVPVVSNYGKFQTQISETIMLLRERANLEFSSFLGKIMPIFYEVFVTPLIHELENLQESERESDEVVFYKLAKKSRIFEEDGMKRIVREYVSHDIFLQALSLGKTSLDMLSNRLIEEGLKRYRMLTQEMCSGDNELLQRITESMLKCKLITPIVTVNLCMNEYCEHVEIVIADRIPESRCGKCKSDTLSTTFSLVNEPYLTLKDQMLDLGALFYHYTKLKAALQSSDIRFERDLRCYLNAYVTNTESQESREVDVLLYSAMTKKAIVIELKIHQVRSQLPRERLQSIVEGDIRQLDKTLQLTGLKEGCYMTNLIMSDEEVKSFKENLIPKIISRDSRKIEIIPLKDETFLTNLDDLIASIVVQDQ